MSGRSEELELYLGLAGLSLRMLKQMTKIAPLLICLEALIKYWADIRVKVNQQQEAKLNREPKRKGRNVCSDKWVGSGLDRPLLEQTMEI